MGGVDIDAATARGIAVANVATTGTGNAESVAEWCVMAAIAASRRLPTLPAKALDDCVKSSGYRQLDQPRPAQAWSAEGGASAATGAGETAAHRVEVHEVATDTAGAAAAGATDAALAPTTGAEQGQDSTCREQLHVLAVELGKAQCVRHPDPPRRGPQRAGNRAPHRLHRQFGLSPPWSEEGRRETCIRP
ncbi:MAG: hypothetical protein ACRDRR_17950 [Pseudonocardiaceae bacterium]